LFDNPLAGASTLFYKQSLDFQAVGDGFPQFRRREKAAN
jgi:hypothetical protein